MALKKSQLYSSLWQSCDELRGGMDASQYKDYILTLLFMKYVSDKFAGQEDALIEVPDGGGFEDMVKLKGDKEIGDKINKIIGRLAEVNDLKGVITEADFNDEDKLGRGKEMQDRLSKLVAIFDGLDFRANRAEGDDLLGDAYEYLMRHFATESGKSKGQFYTPAEVSRILAKVIGIDKADELHEPTVYDPTCGSASLLIKAADEANTPKLAIYGQEMDNATWALAKMNMILHGHPTADLWRDNTLSSPWFKNPGGGLKTFNFAVANPPFSSKSWSTGFNPEEDEYNRFEYGIPPAKNGDFAFLLHLIKSLKSKGKAAIILPHGVLFRGNKEATIRKNLIKRGLIKGIIGLPANLFYGTGIPASIIVIDKENAHARTGIFIVDASNGYIKDGNKNRLRSQDLHKIVDIFTRQIELLCYSRMVPVAEIADSSNDYNLNIPRYIDSSEPEDLHDLDGHLNGGIPDRDIDDLQDYWDIFLSLRKVLFTNLGRPGYNKVSIASAHIKQTITDHPEFTTYNKRATALFGDWQCNHDGLLKDLQVGDNPKAVIKSISEDLLNQFAEVPLLNKYDVYQQLMDYWAETMQDDVYLIVADGWIEAAKPRGVIEDKEKKIKETPDLTIGRKKYKMDLIPPSLIVARFFADEQDQIDELQSKQDEVAHVLEEFVEEHAVEEGLLEEAVNDKGKVNKTGVTARLKAINVEMESEEESNALKRCLRLIETESAAGKAVRDAQAKLNTLVFDSYSELTEEEIKVLVVDDKWLTAIQAGIGAEIQRIIQRLANRVKELEERYSDTLPELEKKVDEVSKKVAGHLKKMGIIFND